MRLDRLLHVVEQSAGVPADSLIIKTMQYLEETAGDESEESGLRQRENPTPEHYCDRIGAMLCSRILI